jgi:hypothetical protein
MPKAKIRSTKRYPRLPKTVTLNQVLDDIRRLRASSTVVYSRVIRELDKQRVA